MIALDMTAYKGLIQIEIADPKPIAKHRSHRGIQIPLPLCQIIAAYLWDGMHLKNADGLRKEIDIDQHRSTLANIFNNPNGFFIEFHIGLNQRSKTTQMYLFEALCANQVYNIRIALTLDVYKNVFLNLDIMGYNLRWTIGNVIRDSNCFSHTQATCLRILVQHEAKNYSVRPEFGPLHNLGTKYLPEWGNYTQFGYNCLQFLVGSQYGPKEAPFILTDFKFKPNSPLPKK